MYSEYYNYDECLKKIPVQFQPFIVANEKFFYVVTYTMQNEMFYFFSANTFPLAIRLFNFNSFTIRALDLVKKKHCEIGALTGCYLESKYRNSSYVFVESASDIKAFPHLQDLAAKKDFFENVFYNKKFEYEFFRDGFTKFPKILPWRVLRFPLINFHIDKFDAWEKQFLPNLQHPKLKQMYGTVIMSGV